MWTSVFHQTSRFLRIRSRCKYTARLLQFKHLYSSPQISFSNKPEQYIISNCNIGTIGHVDHGKTTLTAAITKVLSEKGYATFTDYDQIDKGEEEKARGITINTAHIGYRTDKRRYAHTDCPGHKDFLKNMICGTAQMDGVVLVVAATDGPMPQTNEHLSLARALGVDRVVIFLNKADLVDEEMLELVQMEVEELLEKYGYDSLNTPFIKGSALCALNGSDDVLGKQSILELLDAVDNHIQLPERKVDGTLFMPIESAFTLPGRGTVAIGTIANGELRKNDPIQIMGYGRDISSFVSDIQRFKESALKATAGDNVGVLVRGVNRSFIERGMVLCKAGSREQINYFEAQLYIRTKEEGGRSKPIRENYQQMFFCDLFNVMCLLELPEGLSMIMPGDTVSTTILLQKPVVMEVGQSFIIRENDLYVISGKVTKILPFNKIQVPKFNMKINKPIKVESGSRVVARKRGKT